MKFQKNLNSKINKILIILWRKHDKTKKIKLLINLVAISTISIAGSIIAKVIVDNSSDKARDLNVIIASRGDKLVLNL
ncbi:hypothetical protein RUS47_03855 [Mycoplasmoides gallisepticum]|uniref:hypothetical protein n=1 Tax=Mycoplasmoides gallisepticum TaxID=2096 RepID=UPI00177E31C2|nr:hypothetical protein [Mycoplasmoides gallisepticum]ULH62243.1 hypothetical protein MHC98_03885 [Mycoplasmoides gallisepticum]ULH67583.1 hypothetical protein MHC97_03860 [Mycoplasmoides gallisepticum]ULH68311.1 hypothetical protein MHC99_03885 [Mycoplasmoides gallisepticum]WGG23946.1 hypothetical protein P0D30_04095 [Mycoplasmoides gallisepticum]WGG24706.1 hypothetical protein P0D28_03900 [Mycoplasmoides gallisepticum]